jgi:hypothetical protein
VANFNKKTLEQQLHHQHGIEQMAYGSMFAPFTPSDATDLGTDVNYGGFLNKLLAFFHLKPRYHGLSVPFARTYVPFALLRFFPIL